MSKIKFVVDLPGYPKAHSPYSDAVVANGLVFPVRSPFDQAVALLRPLGRLCRSRRGKCYETSRRS